MGGPGGPFGAGGPFGRHRHGGRVRRGDVRAAILALLAEQPLNGYQIIRTLEEKTSGAWKPSPGAVYPALSVLEDEGLVEQYDNEGQKAFRLTEAGRAQAESAGKPWEAINADNAPRDPESAGALWAAFGDLAMAAKAVTRSGDAAQVAKATEIVGEARRRLYGVLAEPEASSDQA